ncbi:MAG: helix-turn-helix transcriptional regulator [Bacteroidetes bacterium]|nr:helix-turn-helix transcriptional regulator [Bacteroidota bacterium]
MDTEKELLYIPCAAMNSQHLPIRNYTFWHINLVELTFLGSKMFWQSHVRNKILAPVFKRLGIIEQWGNGLPLIKEELQRYPEIELSWKEPGLFFRLTFRKKDFKKQQELQQELQQESLYGKVLRIVYSSTSSTNEISFSLGQKSISGQLYEVIKKLREDGLIEWTIPKKAKSSKQKYRITPKGIAFLNILNKSSG